MSIKSYLLGVLSTIGLASTMNYIWLETHGTKLSKVAFFINYSIIQGEYLALPLSGRCSTTTKNAQGQTSADWFQCDGFQRFINREDK